MKKWILGILGTVIAGVLLQLSTNFLDLSDKGRSLGASGSSAQTEPPPSPKKSVTVMGPLEIGTNRQGNDFDAFGKPAANAELCAEMCRADSACDAMTFVKSTGLCWLKNGVPAGSADADMTSSIKVEHPA